jgi:hypothetical protein
MSEAQRVLRILNGLGANERQFLHGFRGILANDRYRLGWCDVVPWSPVFLAGHAVEVFLDDLFPSRQPIAPAHGKIMAPVWSDTQYQRPSRPNKKRESDAGIFIENELDLVLCSALLLRFYLGHQSRK